MEAVGGAEDLPVQPKGFAILKVAEVRHRLWLLWVESRRPAKVSPTLCEAFQQQSGPTSGPAARAWNDQSRESTRVARGLVRVRLVEGVCAWVGQHANNSEQPFQMRPLEQGVDHRQRC